MYLYYAGTYAPLKASSLKTTAQNCPMPLLDLPPEIVLLIAEYIGSKELRSSTDYLLISKAWYYAVLPVYLSGLQLSTIYVLSNDLEKFPRPNTRSLISQAIQNTVTRLTLCLDGLPSREAIYMNDDKDGLDDDTRQWFDRTANHHRFGSSKSLLGRLDMKDRHGEMRARLRGEDRRDVLEGHMIVRDFDRHDEIKEEEELESRLSHWRDRLNEKLSLFTEILPASENLRQVKIETTLTPRWNYLFSSSLGMLFARLPLNVSSLTVDTSASDFIDRDDGSAPLHVCALLSQRLQSFQHVRIRMRTICPCIFPTSTGLPGNAGSRLQSLFIRLYLPDHLRKYDDTRQNHNPEFHAKSCFPKGRPLYQEMVSAGVQSTKMILSMTALQISYRHSQHRVIFVADCNKKRILSRNYAPDEDGAVDQEPWDDVTYLMDKGPLVPGPGLPY